ncbi:MAG: putA [Gammaproteobacteria bacterium]|jgi:RHH-type proline utilization regulon transcriptional repressor/proline dehydrogenase/delta 1-pyrroline-5-carboxylate dehydrogenase|nr:putA [Gammaproteobacteria bacterium]
MSDFIFPKIPPVLDDLHQTMANAYRMDETQAMQTLLDVAELPAAQLQAIRSRAETLVLTVRKGRVGKGGIDAFMYQYGLSTEEGVALMCLAEAALRIPDTETIDYLIEDKIGSANWGAHQGKSESFFVNSASWALMLTGKILSPQEKTDSYLGPVLKKFVKRTGTPVIRKSVNEAMRILGKQFVMGRTIDEATSRARKEEERGYTFSYDMLGEGARTMKDAERYFEAYKGAIDVIGKSAEGKGIYKGAGISIKLSALHPRYEFARKDYCVPFLIERLKLLAMQAKKYDIGLTVDAEEADRLEISLEIIEAVAKDAALVGWDGLGLAVQAYQKRAFFLIDWLAALGKKINRRFMIRLVKGAYWDYEIKDSQVKGLSGYPVFTRKVNTDVSYLACAKKMIDYGEIFYPQFATHNAYTVAAIMEMIGDRRDYEFQCLKGMGRELYNQLVVDQKNSVNCRIYAPVGQHEDLLPYLVRRLLENGANSSFVHRIVDEKTPVERLIEDPVSKARSNDSIPHPAIPLPVDIYSDRKNSRGVDLSDVTVLSDMAKAMTEIGMNPWSAGSTARDPAVTESMVRDVTSPANHHHVLGKVTTAVKEDIEYMMDRALKAKQRWNDVPVEARAAMLEKVADLFEENATELMAITMREAGKTLADAVGEVREAVDFCRYYANLAKNKLMPVTLPGPTGESNELSYHGRGVMLCISPWNFPLAIFTGQAAACLVAGNCVLAKPADQTILIGAKAVELMHKAGIPDDVIQLVPGRGSVIGAAAVANEKIAGVIFTGSTETAQTINQTLAHRKGPIVPFVAETGGQNCMIADSTALPEQLVQDVMSSAFNSAGQRCSAMRVLFLPSNTADRIIEMLKGAMSELIVGDPRWLVTDVGPVIDDGARQALEEHAQRMNKEAKLIYEVPLSKETQNGTFFAPRVYEIPSLDILTREVFGPVLHIIRYERSDLDKILDTINNTGYGLTCGVHTRIAAVADYITSRINAGNAYVNRNMIGAVVGVQPFGGEGLSGTGPKAGGPNYLSRLCHERTLTVNTTAAGGNASLMAMD